MHKWLLFFLSMMLLVACSSMQNLAPSIDTRQLQRVVMQNPQISAKKGAHSYSIEIPMRELFYEERLLANEKTEQLIDALAATVQDKTELGLSIRSYTPQTVMASIDMLTEEMASALYHSLRKAGVKEEQITIEYFVPGCAIEQLVADSNCYFDQKIIFTIGPSVSVAS